MTAPITLPPLLPDAAAQTYGYTNKHMRDYATAAVLLDREQRGEPMAWRDTVDDMLTVCHEVASDDPRESINRLINWHVSVALDPAVSSDAAALVQSGREQRGEPVAYLWQHSETGRTRVVMPDQIITTNEGWSAVGPLYLHPQPVEQRKPLTEDQIAQISAECALVTPSDLYFAREIERAHGIGEGKP